MIDELIRQDMSPEQPSARLTLKYELSIIHETIYQYIYADKQAGDDLRRHLRCQKPRRSIMEEDLIVVTPSVTGSALMNVRRWLSREYVLALGGCDTVIGKNHQGALVTLAERRSRYVLAGQLHSKHSVGVTVKINSLLRLYKHKCHIGFAHPYHSWERGLNENSNGLLRQYFPKNWN